LGSFDFNKNAFLFPVASFSSGEDAGLIMVHYYDSDGNHNAYSLDGKHLFNRSGEYIGYFLNDRLHSDNREIIGYKRGKSVYDNKGQPLYAAMENK